MSFITRIIIPFVPFNMREACLISAGQWCKAVRSCFMKASVYRVAESEKISLAL